jgi:hypothetical protein
MSDNRLKQKSGLDKNATALPSKKDTRTNSQIFALTVLIIIVAIAVIATHWPMLSAKAFSFDDIQYLSENLLVQNPSLASAWRFLVEVLKPSTVHGYYQPLAMISIMLDYAMGGRDDNLQPFHRTSLALHVANTALVIVLLYLLFDRAWVAAMVGLLFGVHPMTVEPSVWISDRKTLLATFFALWCLILYICFTRKKSWRFYSACLLTYVLSLMSKPTSTPLPVLLLLLDYWPIRRISKQTVLEKLPFFVVGGISAIITYISQKGTASVAVPAKYDLGRIPLTFCHNIIFYLYKMFWPVNLSSHYAFPNVLRLSDPMVLAGVIGTCILIPSLVISLHWTRALLTGWLIFFVAILPTMQVIEFSDVIASDKFAYLPSIGLLMILAWFLAHLWGSASLNRIGIRQAGLIAVVLVLAASESVAARHYLVHWQDTESLWRYMVRITPWAPAPHRGLGDALLRNGKVEEAISEYKQHIQLMPNSCAALNNLAWILATNGNPQVRNPAEAVELAERAYKITPYDRRPETLDTLAAAYAAAGRFDEAVRVAEKAMELTASSNVNRRVDALRSGIRSRIDLYRQRKPYYESTQPAQ